MSQKIFELGSIKTDEKKTVLYHEKLFANKLVKL